MAIETQQRRALRDEVVGRNPSEYGGIFRQAFTDNLGQPGIPDGFDRRALDTVERFGDIYIDQYVSKYGRLPTTTEVSNFLGQSINTGVAEKALTGQLPDSAVIANFITPTFEANDAKEREAGFAEEARNIAKERMALSNRLADEQIAESQAGIDRNFGDARRRLIGEQAALGRLDQPNSTANFQRLEAQRGQSLADAARSIRAQNLASQNQIQGESLGAIQNQGNFGAQIGLQRQSLQEQVRQFNEKQQTEQSRFRQEVALQRELARLQADANKPGTLDYIGTAFQGLSALGGLASGVGAIGSIGGLAGTAAKASKK